MLLNVSGPSDLGLFEVNEAAEIVAKAAHADANIIFGAVIDDGLGDEVRITVIAAGFDRYEGERRPTRLASLGLDDDLELDDDGIDFSVGASAADAGGDDDFDVPEFFAEAIAHCAPGTCGDERSELLASERASARAGILRSQ